MAELPISARLTYVGLWCLADDAGYFELNVREIGGALYRHEPRRVREKRVEDALDKLVESERVQRLPCGDHALIPTLPEHRFNAGTMIFTVQKRHESCQPVTLSLGLATPSVSRASDKSPSDSVSDSSSLSDSSSSSGRRGAKNGSKDPDEEKRKRIARNEEIVKDESQPDWKRRAAADDLAAVRA